MVWNGEALGFVERQKRSYIRGFLFHLYLSSRNEFSFPQESIHKVQKSDLNDVVPPLSQL